MQAAKYADAQTPWQVNSVYCLQKRFPLYATGTTHIYTREEARKEGGQTKSGSWLSLNYTMPVAKLRPETYT